MESYNDYYGITQDYLRNYSSFKLALDNLRQERLRLEFEYSSLKTPTAKYGLEPGGESELTMPEQSAERRIIMLDRIHRIGADISALHFKIMQLETAINSLNDTERKIIDLRFNKRMPWMEVAGETGYSERGCKKRGYGIIKTVSMKLFGYRIIEQRRFHFVS